MKISVTARHIAIGKPANCITCPVAVAVQEATGDPHAFAGPNEIEVRKRSYRTPESVTQFMRDFDQDRPVSPFEFELV